MSIQKLLRERLTEVLAPNIYHEEPITDSQTLKVYHGFNMVVSALQTIKYGLSGSGRARRIYSYESGNNPNGLFVTTQFTIAKRFDHSGIIIEFHSKLTDLEAPVWKGQDSYFVQGQMTQSFADAEERQQKISQQREKYKQSKLPYVAQSDRPELADALFDNPERQALFIGELDPIGIKNIWVKEELLFNRRTTGSYQKYNRVEFLKKYGETLEKQTTNQGIYSDDYNHASNRWFRPSENWDLDAAYNHYMKNSPKSSLTKEKFLDILKGFDSNMLNTELWPKQVKQFEKLYGENMKSKRRGY